MSDGERRTESVILDYGTTKLVTHGAQLGQTQGVAVLSRRCRVTTDVHSEIENEKSVKINLSLFFECVYRL